MIDFPEIAEGDPVVVSATVYATYLRCPDQARARLAGEYPAESQVAFRGMLAHRLFARHLSSGPVPSEALSQSCREEIGRSLNPKLAALRLKPSRLEAVVREVGDLYERFKRFPAEGFQGAEIELRAEPVPGVVLRGVVDAVFAADDGVRIVDWKTGSLGTAEPQLDFYALLWALDRGALPVIVEATSVATGERYTNQPDLAGLRETAQQISQLVTEVRTAFAAGERLLRTGGPWCRFCPLLDDCAEGRTAAVVNA